MHPKASREAQIQNFKTMIVAVRTAYITVTINFWPLHFYRYTLIKQIKVQLSLSNVCNKVQCISTALTCITTGYSQQCLLSCLLRNVFKKPCGFDFQKMLFKTPQKNLHFYTFFVNILHLCLLKNIILP